jgi:hypothetical protein
MISSISEINIHTTSCNTSVILWVYCESNRILLHMRTDCMIELLYWFKLGIQTHTETLVLYNRVYSYFHLIPSFVPDKRIIYSKGRMMQKNHLCRYLVTCTYIPILQKYQQIYLKWSKVTHNTTGNISGGNHNLRENPCKPRQKTSLNSPQKSHM